MAKILGALEIASDTNYRYPISSKFHKALEYVEIETPLNYRKVLIRS